MENLHDYEEQSIPVLGALNIARHIRNRRRGWRRDWGLEFRPLHDHGPARLSLGEAPAGATDVLVELARIELNAKSGRPLDEGLPEDSVFKQQSQE